jgi:hypothetical protein
MQGISWLAEELLASLEGLISMELLAQLVIAVLRYWGFWNHLRWFVTHSYITAYLIVSYSLSVHVKWLYKVNSPLCFRVLHELCLIGGLSKEDALILGTENLKEEDEWRFISRYWSRIASGRTGIPRQLMMADSVLTFRSSNSNFP